MSFPYPEQSAHAARSARHTQPISLAYAARAPHAPLSAFVRAVSCPVCDAVYAPTTEHESLLHAPSIALESAFLSMCRFCFRCRRPSCPACWDDGNGLCGACMQELALPFRQKLTPFEETLLKPASSTPISSSPSSPSSPSFPASSPSLPPLPSASFAHSNDAPLRCIYTGRFEQTSPSFLSSQSSTRRTAEPVSVTRGVLSAQESPVARRTARLTTPLTAQDDTAAQSAQPAHPQTTGITTQHTSVVATPQRSRARHITYVVGRVFTTLLLIALSIAVLLVVGATFSTQANTLLAHIIHIDIRAIILALWNALRQLFTH